MQYRTFHTHQFYAVFLTVTFLFLLILYIIFVFKRINSVDFSGEIRYNNYT